MLGTQHGNLKAARAVREAVILRFGKFARIVKSCTTSTYVLLSSLYPVAVLDSRRASVTFSTLLKLDLCARYLLKYLVGTRVYLYASMLGPNCCHDGDD